MKVEEVEKYIFNKWKKYFPKITQKQSLICERLACLNLNNHHSEGSVVEYMIENNLFKPKQR